MKYLIINADDFGYNSEQNEAILDLAQKGLITSTSVLAVGPKAAECEKLNNIDISVGVHLAINSDCQENRWQSLTKAQSLGGKTGLPTKQSDLTFKAKRKDVLAELFAQYEFVSSRVPVDHADNHCGTLYGINGRRFYLDAYSLCEKFSLPYRFPKTDGFLTRQMGREMPKPVLAFQQMIVKKGEEKGVNLLDDLISNPWNIERIGTYENLRDYYINQVKNLKDGVTEMFLHPAKPLSDEKTEWTKRVFEYKLLKSGDLLECAEKTGVQVVSWKIFDII